MFLKYESKMDFELNVLPWALLNHVEKWNQEEENVLELRLFTFLFLL